MIDVSEGIDVNKAEESRKCIALILIITTFFKLILDFSQEYALVVIAQAMISNFNSIVFIKINGYQVHF